jgi:hypothetical protein
MMRWRRFLPYVLLALLPLMPLWRAVFLGEAIGPFDQIRHMAPWNGPNPSQPWDVLQADGVLQFYPWRDLVLQAWGKGHLPLWNPYELAGTPLLANSQSAGFYPLHILYGLLHLPTAFAITVLAWKHLAWAGFGVYFLTRKLGGSRLGATIAGASFLLSPFMLDWTALASVIETVSWIPWILACIVTLYRGGGKARPVAAAALAASVAMMLLAGHLQFAAYGLLFAVLFAIGSLRAVPKDDRQTPEPGPRWPLLIGVGAALLLGGLISAPQVLPVLSYSKFSHRQNAPTQEGYGAYVKGAIKPFELATLAYPTALGSPRTPIDAGGYTVSQYWPMWVKQGANFAESAVCVGPLVLAGLFVVPWRRRELWPLAGLGLLALLLALGTALNMPLYFLVPGWSASGSPGRVIVLFVLCASVLGGLGLGEAAKGFGKKEWVRTVAGLAIGTGLAFSGQALAPAPPGDAIQQIQSAANASLVPVMLIALVLSIAGLALLGVPSLGRFRPAVVLFPALLCWLGYGSDIVTTGKPLDPIAGVAPGQRVAFINGSWDIQVAGKAIAPPNTASLSRIHEIGGYDSLLHRDTVALLRDVNGQHDAAPEVNGNMMFVKPGADSAKLAAAGVTATWDRDQSEPTALKGPGRCSVDGGSCRILEEDTDSIVLSAEGGGRLTLRDRMMPGWTARVDGREVPVTGDLWRTVELGSPGSHKVEFNYSAPGFHTGLALGAIGLLGLGVTLLPTLRRRERV